jgi:hypothetical protein
MSLKEEVMGNVLEKLKGWDASKILPLIEAFPGEKEGAEAVLRGEKRIILEDIIRKFFDHTGRAIPSHLGITAKVCDENRDFHAELPELSCTEIREQVASFFSKGTEFAETGRFEDETAALKEKYFDHELIGNFFQRAQRIIFPKHDARKNYGASLQGLILPAVERAYKKSFPERKFTNYRDGNLTGNVKIIPKTGHEDLVSLMAEKSVSAWYSPNPFQGFSIFAQREAMKVLTQYGWFALAGGIDTGIVMATYAGAMARDFHTPVYTCGSISWRSAGCSLGFGAHGGGFGFAHTGRLSDAFDGYSGGLVLFR